MRHFLKETDFARHEINSLFALTAALKKGRGRHTPPSLDHQSWGLLFFKKSTRTRVSFQVGVQELGGFPVVLTSQDMQLSRGETVADTARVLSRYLHGLVIRTFEHSMVEEFAAQGTIPIINGLTDFLHPCQIYTDLFTLGECWSDTPANMLESLRGRKIAFFGDTACNVANSWILAGAYLGFEVALAGPEAFAPGPEIRAQLKAEGLEETFQFTSDPVEAARDADMVYTDVWVSMGKEDEEAARIELMMPYQVDSKIMAAAKKDAYFMHCLPAHPGLEVSREVLDGPRSIIFDQAENRLHTQKAILAQLAEANR